MNAELTRISPATAKEWLAQIPDFQRKITRSRVLTLVMAIQRGQWAENGSTIVFNTKGDLIDGQHRLTAISEAGRTVWAIVVKGVTSGEATFSTIDDTKSRTIQDFLHHSKNRNIVSTAMRFHWMAQNKFPLDSKPSKAPTSFILSSMLTLMDSPYRETSNLPILQVEILEPEAGQMSKCPFCPAEFSGISSVGGHIAWKHKDLSDEERFWVRVDKENGPISIVDGEESKCWLWLGGHNGKNYAYFWYDGSTKQAYKFAYVSVFGPVPGGLELDHKCRNTRCVRPTHVEPVTRSENQRRSPISISGANIAKTECPRGHPYDTVTKKGARTCSICSAAATKVYRSNHLEQSRAKCREYMAKHRDELREKAHIKRRLTVTKCKNGHELAGDNLHVAANGYRKCRACKPLIKQALLNYWKRKKDSHAL